MNIKDATIEQLKLELQKRSNDEQVLPLSTEWPDSPIGVWKVTTDGDCEGRSTKTIGVFEGHVVDIALQLSKQACYSLRFSPVANPEVMCDGISSGDNVSLVLDIKSGTWPSGGTGMDSITRAIAINAWLNKDQPEYCEYFDVTENNYYASVRITAK